VKPSRATASALFVGLFAWGALGCESADPDATPGLDAGQGEPGCAADESITNQDNPGCQPEPSDYQPRDQGSANDDWPACISDDNEYHPFDENISTNARVAAFEQIAELLGFGQGKAPSPAEFAEARVAYTQEEGLDSRVSRREDEHYPPAPEKCRDLSEAEQADYPERCVGPVQIQPLITEAFEQGIDGAEPALDSARLEAAFLWFFYVSSYKEAMTCTVTTKDCDSSTGYYAGNQSRSPSYGFASYVEPRSAQTHEAAWDALLAVRCWRDLDNPDGVAEDTDMRDQALGQLDRALDRGLALILRQRVEALPCDTAWQTVQILAPVIDRAATARDSGIAADLQQSLEVDSDQEVDVEAVTEMLDELFPCP